METSVPQALAKLRAQFVERLSGRLDEIQSTYVLLDPSDWAPETAGALHRLLHGLVGAAGTFGMPTLSEQARAVEVELRAAIEVGAPEPFVWRGVGARVEALVVSAAGYIGHLALVSKSPVPAPLDVLSAPLIYLLERDADQGAVESLLVDGGFRVQRFVDFSELSARCGVDEGLAAIVVDLCGQDGGQRDVTAIAKLKVEHKCCPPVVFTSVGDDLATRLAIHRAGVSRCLTKPLDTARLLQMLDELTGRIPPEPYRVLLVDDDPLMLDAHAVLLEQNGVVVERLSAPLKTLDVLESFRPDVLVLDVLMPDVTGPELAAVLRARECSAQLPILFLSAVSDVRQQLLALDLGGDDFLVKPVDPQHFRAAVLSRARRVRQRARTVERLRRALYERERERLALNKHALVSVTDAAGRITYANERFCEVSGYSPGELLGKTHRVVRSDRHDDKFYAGMWRTLCAGEVWAGEICNRRKDGGYYWVEATITPFFNERGRPYQYVAIRTDITALKRSEIRVRESDERLRLGQIYANIGTWDWNIQTGALYWSERIAPLFGYHDGELETSYDNFMAAIHPDDRQAVQDAVSGCVERDEPYEIEHRVVWPDGQVRWLFERGAVVRDADGAPLHMLGMVQDIHDRKLADERLRLFQRIFNTSEQAIAIADGDARFIFVNQAHEQMLGYTLAELKGKTFVEVAAHDYGTSTRETLFETLHQTGSFTGLMRVCHKDGHPLTIRSNIGALRDDSGLIQFIFSQFTDFSEELSRQQELAEAKEAAERASQAKSDFLSSMSHELRTPMNAVLGFAQLLEDDGVLDEEQTDNVQEILGAGRHLLILINDILDLARVESGQTELAMEAMSLLPLLKECVSLVSLEARQREITVCVAVPEEAKVQADPLRLKQVVLNLLSNGIKYNRHGGRIDLTWAVRGSKGCLTVADTGVGIADDRMPLLFEPFARFVGEHSPVEGTGIGLTITRKLITMMGGTIEVDSVPGVGSRFTVALPLAVPVDGALWAEPSIAEGGARAHPHRVSTVLYVEDNAANLKLVRHVFARWPHVRLLTAETGALGIEVAMAERPDLVLLDLNLPDIDGYEVLKVLRAAPALRACPVVAVSANALLRDIERGRAAGFDDYLTKPFELQRFIEVVNLWLNSGLKVEAQ